MRIDEFPLTLVYVLVLENPTSPRKRLSPIMDESMTTVIKGSLIDRLHVRVARFVDFSAG
jgi:hypothetical protein